MDSPLASERNREFLCESIFNREGPFFHVYTSHSVTEVLFGAIEDIRFVINVIGYYSYILKVRIVAFAVMSTHIHILYADSKNKASEHICSSIDKLCKYLRTKGIDALSSSIAPSFVGISSLKQFRDELAYILRNPFVARSDVNLFSSPYTSGYLYFNSQLDSLVSEPFDSVTIRRKREMLKQRDLLPCPGLRVRNGTVEPESFVDYKLAESLFPDARKYVMWMMKSLESQVEIARSRGENPLLNDDEVLSIVFRLCRESFGVDKVRMLTSRQRQDLAQTLKRHYGASNKQIMRCLSLPPETVDAMFPLSSRP